MSPQIFKFLSLAFVAISVTGTIKADDQCQFYMKRINYTETGQILRTVEMPAFQQNATDYTFYLSKDLDGSIKLHIEAVGDFFVPMDKGISLQDENGIKKYFGFQEMADWKELDDDIKAKNSAILSKEDLIWMSTNNIVRIWFHKLNVREYVKVQLQESAIDKVKHVSECFLSNVNNAVLLEGIGSIYHNYPELMQCLTRIIYEEIPTDTPEFPYIFPREQLSAAYYGGSKGKRSN